MFAIGRDPVSLYVQPAGFYVVVYEAVSRAVRAVSLLEAHIFSPEWNNIMIYL
jgi:hypothetical protein